MYDIRLKTIGKDDSEWCVVIEEESSAVAANDFGDMTLLMQDGVIVAKIVPEFTGMIIEDEW